MKRLFTFHRIGWFVLNLKSVHLNCRGNKMPTSTHIGKAGWTAHKLLWRLYLVSVKPCKSHLQPWYVKMLRHVTVPRRQRKQRESERKFDMFAITPATPAPEAKPLSDDELEDITFKSECHRECLPELLPRVELEKSVFTVVPALLSHIAHLKAQNANPHRTLNADTPHKRG